MTLNVSRETWRDSPKLQLFADNLMKWQKKINLTAPNEDIWQRHIKQSLELINFFPQNITDNFSVADFGTGAGFPGLIAAIYYQENFHNHDKFHFHLVESDARKVAFLREIARITHTKIHLHHCRIENLPIQTFDIITARALTNLSKLLDYSSNFMHQNTLCLFYKGKNYQTELTEALKSWHINEKVIPLSEQHTFLIACKEISHADGNKK